MIKADREYLIRPHACVPFIAVDHIVKALRLGIPKLAIETVFRNLRHSSEFFSVIGVAKSFRKV